MLYVQKAMQQEAEHKDAECVALRRELEQLRANVADEDRIGRSPPRTVASEWQKQLDAERAARADLSSHLEQEQRDVKRLEALIENERQEKATLQQQHQEQLERLLAQARDDTRDHEAARPIRVRIRVRVR